MARVIQFYVPARFQARLRWLHADERGKLLQFVPGPQGKYIWLPNGALWPVREQSANVERRRLASASAR